MTTKPKRGGWCDEPSSPPLVQSSRGRRMSAPIVAFNNESTDRSHQSVGTSADVYTKRRGSGQYNGGWLSQSCTVGDFDSRSGMAVSYEQNISNNKPFPEDHKPKGNNM